MRGVIAAFLILLPGVAFAAALINSSKIVTYSVLDNSPPPATVGSTKVVTYVVLDSSPAVGSTKVNNYVVLDGPYPGPSTVVPSIAGPFTHP